MDKKTIEVRNRFWQRAFWWYVDEVAQKRLTNQDTTEGYRMLDRIIKTFFQR